MLFMLYFLFFINYNMLNHNYIVLCLSVFSSRLTLLRLTVSNWFKNQLELIIIKLTITYRERVIMGIKASKEFIFPPCFSTDWLFMFLMVILYIIPICGIILLLTGTANMNSIYNLRLEMFFCFISLSWLFYSVIWNRTKETEYSFYVYIDKIYNIYTRMSLFSRFVLIIKCICCILFFLLIFNWALRLLNWGNKPLLELIFYRLVSIPWSQLFVNIVTPFMQNGFRNNGTITIRSVLQNTFRCLTLYRVLGCIVGVTCGYTSRFLFGDLNINCILSDNTCNPNGLDKDKFNALELNSLDKKPVNKKVGYNLVDFLNKTVIGKIILREKHDFSPELPIKIYKDTSIIDSLYENSSLKLIKPRSLIIMKAYDALNSYNKHSLHLGKVINLYRINITSNTLYKWSNQVSNLNIIKFDNIYSAFNISIYQPIFNLTYDFINNTKFALKIGSSILDSSRDISIRWDKDYMINNISHKTKSLYLEDKVTYNKNSMFNIDKSCDTFYNSLLINNIIKYTNKNLLVFPADKGLPTFYSNPVSGANLFNFSVMYDHFYKDMSNNKLVIESYIFDYLNKAARDHIISWDHYSNLLNFFIKNPHTLSLFWSYEKQRVFYKSNDTYNHYHPNIFHNEPIMLFKKLDRKPYPYKLVSANKYPDLTNLFLFEKEKNKLLDYDILEENPLKSSGKVDFTLYIKESDQIWPFPYTMKPVVIDNILDIEFKGVKAIALEHTLLLNETASKNNILGLIHILGEKICNEALDILRNYRFWEFDDSRVLGYIARTQEPIRDLYYTELINGVKTYCVYTPWVVNIYNLNIYLKKEDGTYELIWQIGEYEDLNFEGYIYSNRTYFREFSHEVENLVDKTVYVCVANPSIWEMEIYVRTPWLWKFQKDFFEEINYKPPKHDGVGSTLTYTKTEDDPLTDTQKITIRGPTDTYLVPGLISNHDETNYNPNNLIDDLNFQSQRIVRDEENVLNEVDSNYEDMDIGVISYEYDIYD